jgi:hypothetical protein
MRVRLARLTLEGAPNALVEKLQLTKPVNLTLGQTYEVHASYVVDNLPDFLLVPDNAIPFKDAPFWYPAWYFDLIESACPSDWIYTFFNQTRSSTSEYPLSLVLGPRFIAESAEACAAMSESLPQSVYEFWNRWESLQIKAS